MRFLMNDVVLTLETEDFDSPVEPEMLAAMPFEKTLALGAELFAAEPQLQWTHPLRARRLAALITTKAPTLNAALFVAPRKGCRPGEVSVRYAELAFDLISGLYTRQQEGALRTDIVDRDVWMRLAAA